MRIVDPPYVLGRLDGRNIKIDDDWFLAASNQDAFERLVGVCIDFLVRHVRRDVDEIARARFGRELEMIAPSHARFAFDDVDDALEFAVVMRAGLRIGMNAYGAGPELRRTGPRVSNRGSAIHPGRLRRVRVEFAGMNDANSVMFPIKILVAHFALFRNRPRMTLI